MSREDAFVLARAEEQLRQERETFDQQRRQDHLWFTLRLAVGYSSILLLGAIVSACILIIAHEPMFPPAVVMSATGVLFSDVLGLLVTVWKVVLNPGRLTRLGPVTMVRPRTLPAPT
jgi:hypothetical protein